MASADFLGLTSLNPDEVQSESMRNRRCTHRG